MDEQHHCVDGDDRDAWPDVGACSQRVRPGRDEQAEEVIDEKGEPEVDARRHRDLAEQVEPAGDPAPPGAALAAELGRPVVKAACGGIARAHLRHGQPDQDHHHAHQRPADVDDGRPAVAHAEVEEREAAGKDRDDRERDGEVREAAHAAQQLLRVAHAVQCLDVRAVSLDAHKGAPP